MEKNPSLKKDFLQKKDKPSSWRIILLVRRKSLVVVCDISNCIVWRLRDLPWEVHSVNNPNARAFHRTDTISRRFEMLGHRLSFCMWHFKLHWLKAARAPMRGAFGQQPKCASFPPGRYHLYRFQIGHRFSFLATRIILLWRRILLLRPKKEILLSKEG